MSENRREVAIIRLAERGRAQMAGATLYGGEVDIENVDHLLAMISVLHDELESARITVAKISASRRGEMQ